MNSNQQKTHNLQRNPIFYQPVIDEDTQQIDANQQNPYQQRIDIIDRFLQEIQIIKQMSFYKH